MFFQFLNASCQFAELALQFQQEMLRQWSQWPWAMATAGSRAGAEQVRALQEHWMGNGAKDADTRCGAASPPVVMRIERATRTTEAPTPRQHDGGSDGSTSDSPRATTAMNRAPAPAAQVCEGTRIQLHEERLEARKQIVELGEVRVRKEVVNEYRTLEVPVRREELVIERRAPAGAPGALSELRPGQEIRIPVREEQVTVEKHPVVKEEVTVGKRVVQETERVGGEVRTEKLHVEREGDVDVHDHAPEPRSS